MMKVIPLLLPLTPFAPATRVALPGLAALMLAGCFGGAPKKAAYEPEGFGSTTTHARSYPASEAQTCEAARRALLSQGYLLTAANAELVTGKKNFQPAPETHVEVEFRVVCARQDKGTRGSTAFATAVQDRYGIKKGNSSASVGVGVIGSLSLPFSQSDDAMVKLASETLTDERFYDRFFALLGRYLVVEPVEEKAPAAPPPAVPAPASDR